MKHTKMTRWAKSLAGLMLVASLASCGGGGGDAGDSKYGSGSGGSNGGSGETPTTVAPTMTLSLTSTDGAPLPTPAVTGSSTFNIRVTLTGANGSPVSSKIVTVSADDLTLDPVSGKSLTANNGVVVFGASQTDSTATGATSVCAAATVDSVELTRCVDIQMGAVSADLSGLVVSPSTVDAYQTAQVSVAVTQSGSATPAVGVPVSFSASCGSVSPTTATTNGSGQATTSYVNDKGTGSACQGPVTITAATQGSITTAQVIAAAPVPANIQFVQALPARIYLKSSPSTSTSLVTFKLLDASNNPVSGRNLKLDLILYPAGTYLGSTEGTISIPSVTTNAQGQVTVSVNAGTAPGPVQVRATLLDTVGVPTGTVNVSNGLAVASGLPTQRAFSLSVSTFNIEADRTDGVETTLTVRAADRLGNPVPDGTTINFITEGGQVVGSCNTSGAAENKTSACSVTLASQDPRPTDGRVTVLAWAQGEESFVDLTVPNNNVYDSGDTYTELGQPYLDRNFNQVRDVGEDTVGLASGNQACPGGTFAAGNTCDGVWGKALVFGTTEVIFSGSRPFLSNAVKIVSGLFCTYEFSLRDLNGNPMPAGTTLSVVNLRRGMNDPEKNAAFQGFGGQGNRVPNTNSLAEADHSVIVGDCENPSTLSYGLTITTPSGIATTIPVSGF